MIDPFW
jgi:hypothetical protein